MCYCGGGGRQCLVLRGTRVPPSCKWGGTEIGPLLAQIGRRGPTGARRGLPSWGRSCLVYMQRCLSSKSLQTINTQSLPTGAGRVHPSCNCSSTASTLFWSSIDFIIINYGCDLTLLNNNDNEARILSTQWSNQWKFPQIQHQINQVYLTAMVEKDVPNCTVNDHWWPVCTLEIYISIWMIWSVQCMVGGGKCN